MTRKQGNDREFFVTLRGTSPSRVLYQSMAVNACTILTLTGGRYCELKIVLVQWGQKAGA